MDLSKISAGNNPPEDINVVIEIPAQGGPVKYEVDMESGALVVDRFMATAMYYPTNYGFIPQTLSEDGDPIDVMLVAPFPLQPGSVIRARPVGMLEMTDESGVDAKIIAVPHDKLTPHYQGVKKVEDLPSSLLEQIQHFFEQYKALEPGKWVECKGFADKATACQAIESSIARHEQQ
ncbi:MAG TPA: inorganic diphosphatase [Guyparkeria sp.]|nr:inorganic diphosphatase [Guyparkeria sp.]